MVLDQQYTMDIENPPEEVDIPSHKILYPSGGTPTEYICPVRRAYVSVSPVSGDRRVTHSIIFSCISGKHPYSKRQQKELGSHTQCHTSIERFV